MIEMEAGELIRQTFIERGDTRAKDVKEGPKIAENFYKLFKDRLTNVPIAKRVAVQ